jgi:transporter family protein
MKLPLLFLVILTILFWGLWGFFGKIATGRIGLQVLLWSELTLFPSLILYLIFTKQLLPLKFDHLGITMALSTGLAVGLGSIFYYLLLSSQPASIAVTLTALYPAVTIILALFFLKETFTLSHTVGVLLALIAIYLLVS